MKWCSRVNKGSGWSCEAGRGVFTWGNYVIGLENVWIGRPHEHGSAGGLVSFHSGDRIQRLRIQGPNPPGSCARLNVLGFCASLLNVNMIHSSKESHELQLNLGISKTPILFTGVQIWCRTQWNLFHACIRQDIKPCLMLKAWELATLYKSCAVVSYINK